MSTLAPLSCASTSLNKPAALNRRLNDCTCKFQPKPAGTYTALGFSFSTCQAPTGRGMSGCCGKPSACIDVKRRRMQGSYNYIEQPLLRGNFAPTQGELAGLRGEDALVAALTQLCGNPLQDNVLSGTLQETLEQLDLN